ncbi:MAG: YjgN family protein [Hyphomonadaceae bacterium]
MTETAAPAQAFANSGKFFNVLGLALKNAGLTLATLTVYRFWARTAMRRRIWSRIWVMGDPLEYTGTAGELFRGFLISLPCFFLPAIFVFYIAPFAMDPVGAAWLTFGFYVVVVPTMAAARYWMRRYQLSRTRWRGIRLGLAGSAWGFGFASWGWTILQTLSLGWYTPVARMNRARLLWENARFGDQPFQFIEDGRSPASRLWWPFALGWFGMGLAYLFAAVITVGVMGAMLGAGFDPESGAPSTAQSFAMVFTAFLSFAIFATAFWAPYNAAAMNRIASLITLDGARFRLRAKTFSLYFVTLAGWLMIILSVGLLTPMAGFLQVRYVARRLEIVGEPQFAQIGQSVVAEGRAGESLGDAFDLDMGVGII